MSARRLLVMLGLLCPFELAADPVQLSAMDGSFSIEGELISYDGEFFRLNTDLGQVTVDGGTFRCTGIGCPDPAEMVARVRVGGAPEMLHRLMPALLEVFADTRGLRYARIFSDDDSVSWELHEAETDRLIAVFEGSVVAPEQAKRKLASRELDIVLTRQSAQSPVRQDIIALDALVPIVAPDNPRAMVTHAQLQGLLSGRISNWSRLGGEDLPITLHLPQGREAQVNRLLPSGAVADATRHDGQKALAEAVAADPAALGLAPYSSIGNAVPLVISGACGLATPATRDTIRAEDYPITEPMFLQRIGARQAKIVRDFIAYARSAEAQPVVRAAGFVDQAIGMIPFEQQGDRIANAVLGAGESEADMLLVRDMIATLMTADRLTLTFRFQDGSSDLDVQSESNIQRLAEAVQRGDLKDREIIFVGFSDGVGPPDGNRRLSERRARAVRKAVSAQLQDLEVPFGLAAFGEISPMACDDTPWGRLVNRRVEVWVR